MKSLPSLSRALLAATTMSFVFPSSSLVHARRNIFPAFFHASQQPLGPPLSPSRVLFSNCRKTSPRRLATIVSSASKSDILDYMLHRIDLCNSVPTSVRETLVPFIVDDRLVGKVRPKLADILLSLPDAPFVERPPNDAPRRLSFSPALSSPDARSSAVAAAAASLRDSGIISGWRDELLPVTPALPCDRAAFLIERAAAPHFGTVSFGVHVNGYVADEAAPGGKRLWAARRARSKGVCPGMLDHIVAGGQPAGIGLMENVIKECAEEAGIGEALASRAIPVGAVSYEYFVHPEYTGGNVFPSDDGTGTIKRDVLFCFDLELPADFEPVAVDGEVEEFFLMDLGKVAECMAPDTTDPIKPNCNLVIADFMLRHGFVGPDDGPAYFDVVKGLRPSIM